MLLALHVRDLALVDELWLEFGEGLTVLTGETGAGKTVLIEALKLLLGERADATLVRQGATEALVEGTFLIDGREVLVKRRVSAEGRSRCVVDGELATVGMLADLLGGLVDLHGQHEHQALLSPARHAEYLDRYIGDPAVRAKARYQEAWHRARDARRALADLERALADRDRRAEYLRFQIADIDSVRPVPGEDEELRARLPRLRHAERLAEAVAAALGSLKGEGGVSDHLTAAVAALRSAADLDPALDALAAEVGRLDVELAEVSAGLRTYADSLERDPDALDATERRLRELADIARKYGPTLEDVVATRARAAAELEVLEAGEAGLQSAQSAVTAAEAALREAAGTLREVRDAHVGVFTEALATAASELALPHAAFAVERTPLREAAWTAEGPEQVEFLFSASVGEAPRPLAKIASGGEVSRVMLALKSVLGSADAVPVLVFDEVDAGIGGAAAIAVGRRLASLASVHQVLVVTHLAQVAAFADAHVVVAKSVEGGRTVTSARPVAGEERVLEVARMLSGGSSAAGIAHAEELLATAAAERAGEGRATCAS